MKMRTITTCLVLAVALTVALYAAGYVRASAFGTSLPDAAWQLAAALLVSLPAIAVGALALPSLRRLKVFVTTCLAIAVCATVIANLWCFADEHSFLKEAVSSTAFYTEKYYARERWCPYRSFGLILKDREVAAHD